MINKAALGHIQIIIRKTLFAVATSFIHRVAIVVIIQPGNLEESTNVAVYKTD